MAAVPLSFITLVPIRSRTHFQTAPPPGLPANDPGSLTVSLAVLFPFNAIFTYDNYIIRRSHCQDLQVGFCRILLANGHILCYIILKDHNLSQ